MAIVLNRLHHVEPSPEARRLLWHVLSIGNVSRNETEHHQGLDKAGLFLFCIVSGAGFLEVMGKRYPLEKGDTCWLVDLRHARNYETCGGKMLRTDGVRFSGPGLEAWLELLGNDPVFTLPKGELRRHLIRLRRLIQQRISRFEWEIHCEITSLWGELLAARKLFQISKTVAPPCVSKVLEAVFADPARNWQARDLAGIAGISYSRLREHFRQTRGETLHEFLQKTRLDLARHLLGDHRLTVKEVAQRLNFSSEFYFSCFFHRGAGMSPTQFRLRCRT